MASITARGSSWTTTAGAKTVTATPAVGDLIVVLCGNSGRTTAQAPTITCSVQGITFVQIASFTKNSSADSGWVFVSTSLCTAASSTVFTFTPTATDTGGGLAVFSVSGMSIAGLLSLRQTAQQNNAAAGTPSITMGGACLTGNPCFGLVINTTNGSTTTAPPSSWTESYDQGYTTPAMGLEACWRASGNTLTTIAWTGASASAFGSVIVELDASVPASGPLRDASEATFKHLIAQ
jgi:hypothetical protein